MDTNSTIHKINQSRYNLKKYLEKEWDISTIYDLSDQEIDILYRSSKSQNTKISFGYAAGCNFHLYHKNIDTLNLSLFLLHLNFYCRLK